MVKAGGFKLYSKAHEPCPDADGQHGLLITVMKERHARVYFDPSGMKKGVPPLCRSFDGITGKLGKCATCEFAQWPKNGKSPCRLDRDLIVYDHNMNIPYILQFSGGSIRQWNEFKHDLSGFGKPAIAQIIHVTSVELEGQYGSYWGPKFEIVGDVSPEMFAGLKTLRSEVTRPTQLEPEAEPEADEEDDTII